MTDVQEVNVRTSVAEAPLGATRTLMLTVRDLGKVYASDTGEVHALGPVDLTIGKGEFVSLLGPSGCGKTTLLRIIAELEAATSGTVQRYGHSLTDLGMVFQRDILLDWRSIVDNVLLPIEFQNKDRRQFKERARALLRTFGLSGYENKRPWELSGGMRQRAAICRALINEPQLLLMDEPFGALDAMTRDELNVELQRLWIETRKTIVFVTHSISEAVYLSDRVAVVSGRPGRIVEIVEIDFPRPRPLSIRDEAEFGRYSKHLRHILDHHAVAA
jgi:NitT/TauT family transport system ATP-binding protein